VGQETQRQDRIRVVLADDHPEVLEAVAELLADDFEVSRTVSGGASLVKAAADLRPNAVVTDFSSPV
jgi:DNA-binding NarL/FixJ family response regulator